MRRPRSSTLFPYTTLFLPRPPVWLPALALGRPAGTRLFAPGDSTARRKARLSPAIRRGYRLRPLGRSGGRRRSEEHTSELQSRQYLVCRLLLEKKKMIVLK